VDDAEGEVGIRLLAGDKKGRGDGTEAAGLAPEVFVSEPPHALQRFFSGDVWHSFCRSPMAMAAAAVGLLCVSCALFAGWIAPHNPFDLATLELSDSMLPPFWMEGGQSKYLLGTDEQGRDVLSALMYGARISLLVGGASVLLSLVIGVTLGLVSGYVGGHLDAFIMRICDVMLSFPSILIALLIAGVGRALFPSAPDSLAFGVLIIAIALPGWVQAARVIGVAPLRIMRKHVLPNVMGPVLVLSTIQVATAIIAEATLSFLGVGVSPTSPSLGTFINEGNKQLFSGAWWLVIFPGSMLVMIALSINLFGDWLRDALNPRLR
jgi:peptide/nickel transport system permease protein